MMIDGIQTLKYYSTADHHPPLQAATQGSAGIDIRIMNNYDIQPNQQQDLNTGLYVEIPKGYVGIIVPRSSTGCKGFRLSNTVGVIDSDYRGEIILSCYTKKGETLRLKDGDRVAQMLILPVPSIHIQEVFSLDKLATTERGTAGFGSTGVR